MSTQQELLAAQQENERLRREAAAMREALTELNGCRNQMANAFNEAMAANKGQGASRFWEADDRFGLILSNAISTSAGRDYVSREAVRPIVEALTAVRLNIRKRFPVITSAGLDHLEKALTRARELGLLEEGQ